MNQQQSKIDYFPTHFYLPRDEVLIYITNTFKQEPQSGQPLIEKLKGMKIVSTWKCKGTLSTIMGH